MKKSVLKLFCFMALILPITLMLIGCGTRSGTTYQTIFPDEFKIVVRINTDEVFCEETFIYSNNQYYYKYQGYTQNFESQSTTVLEYLVIKEESSYIHYSYDYDNIQWNYLSTGTQFTQNFDNYWSGLNLYCKAPDSILYDSEKQADEEVNGVDCYVYQVYDTTYKISKDLYYILMSYYAQTTTLTLQYGVQSITTTNVFDGISTALPD